MIIQYNSQFVFQPSYGSDYVNTSYIPQDFIREYQSTTLLPSGMPVGTLYSELIPPELTPEKCKENLAVNFQKVKFVSKLNTGRFFFFQLCFKVETE